MDVIKNRINIRQRNDTLDKQQIKSEITNFKFDCTPIFSWMNELSDRSGKHFGGRNSFLRGKIKLNVLAENDMDI